MELAFLTNLLRTNELIVASIYRECSRLFPEFAADFESLACEEEFHAAVLAEVARDIDEKPHKWRPGRISVKTVHTLQQYLQTALADLRSGNTSPRYAITVLRSFEQGMSEKKVSEMLFCDGVSDSIDLQVIDDGFSMHLKRLQDLEMKIFGTNPVADQFRF